ncbi:MAG: N-acetylmuramoyl-L-alanine amidase [Defluviitaleaceae bacterium]|nr:N-acetylmuramoyl-L-alanine amidase [Defluviitaleaceae bacterium]
MGKFILLLTNGISLERHQSIFDHSVANVNGGNINLMSFVAPAAPPSPQINHPFENLSVFQGLNVFLDPGHGGSERGARGFAQINTMPGLLFPPIGAMQIRFFDEKDIALSIAGHVNDTLQSFGINVAQSRYGDYNVGLDLRRDMANDFEADVFVSIHLNSSNIFNRGTKVLHHPNNPFFEESRELAQTVNDAVVAMTGLRDLGIELGEQVVTGRYTQMPAIITETGYMGGDIRFLINSDNQRLIGESIALGILTYLYNNAPRPTIQSIPVPHNEVSPVDTNSPWSPIESMW